MDWRGRREKFRAVLAGDVCVHPGSVFDPISARIAEDLGFEVGMFAGSLGAFTVIGSPDIVIQTLTEFAQQAYRINRAGKLPLLVDADHGYGNALSVMRTVQELESAGVAAMTIEDTLLQRPYGDGKPGLIPIAEGVGKMKAALAGREDPLLTIVGRTSAAAIAGLDEAIARGKAYEAAGVDALFFTGLTSREELQAISAAVGIPIILGSISGPLVDKAFLGSQRVRVALQGHHPFWAGVNAVYEALKALRDGVQPKDLKGVAPTELVKRMTREADYDRWTKEFLGG
ncbi:MAG: oxaloacetate decarboxylase [Acetobacteraceae bacterium]|nr:oxaloacetate decarboxylase [Acetobacteraceae bacterium]